MIKREIKKDRDGRKKKEAQKRERQKRNRMSKNVSETKLKKKFVVSICLKSVSESGLV